MMLAGWMGRCLLAVGLAATSAAALAADAAAINRAGQERMLTQRIVKAYAQIGLNVMPEAAAGQLVDAISHFEANLVVLEQAATSAAGKQALAAVAERWKPLREAAMKPVTRAFAVDLSQRANAVLAATEQLAQVFRDEGTSPVSHLIDLAGRQRMLSQRVAKAYMLLSWGVDAEGVRAELSDATKAFSAGLKALTDASATRLDILRELDDMALQWEWLQAAIAAEGAVSYRLIVAEATESILATADRVTVMYEKTNGAR